MQRWEWVCKGGRECVRKNGSGCVRVGVSVQRYECVRVGVCKGVREWVCKGGSGCVRVGESGCATV